MSLNNTALLKKELDIKNKELDIMLKEKEILDKEKEIIISEAEEKNVVEEDTSVHETESDEYSDDDDNGFKPFNLTSDDSDDSDNSDDKEDWQEKCDISVYYDKDIRTNFPDAKNFTDDGEAIKEAVIGRYQYVCKLKNGQYYFGYSKTQQSRKTCGKIKNDLHARHARTKRTVWIIDYH